MDYGILIRQLQAAIAGKAIRSGTATVTYPGGSELSTGLNIPHGLPRAPTEVQLTVNSSGVGASYAFVTGSPTDTIIPIQVKAPGFTPAGGTTQTVYWDVRAA